MHALTCITAHPLFSPTPQAQMVAELEAEAAAALAAKEAELAEAQRGLDAAVANRFAQMEKQLDAKVGVQLGGGLRDEKRWWVMNVNFSLKLVAGAKLVASKCCLPPL